MKKKNQDNQPELAFDGAAAPDAAPVAGTPAAETPAGRAPDLGHGAFQRLVDGNFLQYASYVICDRAIPCVEDGLKPVQRRIMHALHEKDDGRFVKVANIVGHTMQYHPHGDASITDALVALVNRGYLVEGQGNFGNIYTGDSAAAARYIECRLTSLAREEVFNDAVTDFVPSYDGRNREPLLLPVKLPLLLMLGAEGIAVGLSTRILPHNFKELLEAQIAIIQKKKFCILPDFPQGGLMDVSEYAKGNGKLRLRAVMDSRQPGKLVINELPFGVTTETLIASIEDAVRRQKVPVKGITDFTAEKVEVELVLKPDADPEKAMAALYAFTSCEVSISCRAIVLRANRPVETNVDDILIENTERLLQTLRRELELKKHNLLEDIHRKTLVQIFVENRIYKKIESCKTGAAVTKAVLDGLAPFRPQLTRDISAEDVEMLLGVRIRRISQFDIDKNRKDIEGILLELRQVEKNLGGLQAYAIRYLKRLLTEYGEPHGRCTRITGFGTIEVRELTARELEIFYDRQSGYFGYDVKGESVLHCSPYDKLIYVWDDCRYKVLQPPAKLFVGDRLLYLAKYDRECLVTLIYTMDHFTYVKRFSFGGVIMEKDYRCAPETSRSLLFADQPVDDVYLKYAPAKGQKIHQQLFALGRIAVKSVKAQGIRLTAKKIARLATDRPRWWNDDTAPPAGLML
ncbi:MAG: DNA topoisomerase IV subunit A [Lentisphaerae bacterium]|nr:DNA topoisomerase IV subunit A [Lentisphaerota bacterium]